MSGMFHKRDTRIHFVGIGGIGMSGIAEVLLTLGYGVAGTDLKESDTTRRLVERGAVVRYGHDAAQPRRGRCRGDLQRGAKPATPRCRRARARGIPVIPRAEMLAELMRMKYGVAVAGSHGKTTTTSLVATVLHEAGLDPTAVIGGKLPLLGSNARLGQGDYLVAEADESDGCFMKLSPTVAVVTNIDPEHLDHYGTLDALKRTFVEFINKVPFYGLGGAVRRPRARAGALAAGREAARDLWLHAARGVSRRRRRISTSCAPRFTAIARGKTLGRVELAMPGRHNVLNSLAVLAVADFLGVDFAVYQRGAGRLPRRGAALHRARRRRAASWSSTTTATTRPRFAPRSPARAPAFAIAAWSSPSSRIATRARAISWATSRAPSTRPSWSPCATSTPPAKSPSPASRRRALVDEMRASGHGGARYVGQAAPTSPRRSLPDLREGDIVITLGAGDVWMVGEEVLNACVRVRD